MPVESRTVIRDVSASLKALIKANVPELNDDSYISFGSPSDIDSSNICLSMCLYYLTESPSMRNSEKESLADTILFYNPPAYLDLFYLMTPYAKDRDTELLILGKLFQLFHEHAVLSGDDLKGNLAACGNEKIRISYNNLSLQDIKQLWEVFPGKPAKLSLSYLISPVKLPSEKIITIPRVLEKDLNVHKI
ncbi:DUF4255 domain-containing protein [Ruminiclostridium cellobioparum]|jgi:hypothetical protein|uniref:Pvc16 N-terminal domain-containing protein n=1 Tax=Ruminiclostridium cellobioparum subsp. termitidis CT1112 TaxID=1195236 RepID=S0FQK5_RUMCE|nr:DUF4255 domain-containing protein [Ruminiclostridium cellobioparum]EMS70758.1 hypothetical protein CTER_3481 [Ruminiclostridium cellobioparum subsp. termitidis CT1112]